MPFSLWKVFPKVSLGCSVSASADENTVYISVATGDQEFLPRCNLNLLGFSLGRVKGAERDSCRFNFIWLNKICFICALSGLQNLGLYRKYELRSSCASGFNLAVAWIAKGSRLCYLELWVGTDFLVTKNGSLQTMQMAWSPAVLKGSCKFSHNPATIFLP